MIAELCMALLAILVAAVPPIVAALTKRSDAKKDATDALVQRDIDVLGRGLRKP